MDTGEELKAWLQNSQKAFTARLDFALKVWQSVDFSYPHKYEVIIKWLADSLPPEQELTVLEPQLQQLYQLRVQPGLVSLDSKSRLIQVLIKKTAKSSQSQHLELLQCMLNSELNQDALRADSQLLMQSYARIFKCYQKSLADPKETQADFLMPLVKQLSDYAQRVQKWEPLLVAYDDQVVCPLVELLLYSHSTCFEEWAALEKHFSDKQTMELQLKRLSKQELPLYVRLIILEAALYNYRFDSAHLVQLFEFVFKPEEDLTQPEETLALAAHLLESLRKHDISLQFYMDHANPNNKKQPAAFAYLSEQLLHLVRQNKQSHLREVVILLRAALRLNPLLIEQSVYQITIWLMTTPKQTAEELELYSQYLVQLLDVFRRLSRAERFIMNLLKSLGEWLAKYQLQVGDSADSGKKRRRLELVEGQQQQLAELYLQHIFASSSPASTTSAPSAHDAFKQLDQTWPSHAAGAAFTKLISHLMSKPSIVMWKTLLHSFSELLEDNSTAVLPSNLNFARELHAALLSQYLLGTRLAEQLHQYQLEIEKQLDHTAQVLEQFGRRLLSQEHNRPLMNAFLECTERASGLELLMAHYWPDGVACSSRSLKLHGFLPPSEWTLLQQRVHNFGKSSCRRRMQRLELQLAEVGWLLQDERGSGCSDSLAELVKPQQLTRLTRAQKQLRIQQKRHMDEDLEDAESVELLTSQFVQEYALSIKEAKVKGALLPKLKLDESPDEATLAKAISQQINKPTKELILPSAKDLVQSLQKLPLSQLGSPIKSRLWLMLFALYQDLISSQEQEEPARLLLEQLIDLMHFGQPLPICSHFPQVSQLLAKIPSSSTVGWLFWETLFARCIRRQASGSEAFLTSCTQHLQEQMAATNKLQPEQCRLLLLAIETLAEASGSQGRRLQRNLQPLLEIYGQMVSHKFRSKKKEASVYKDFVDATLGGYATYVSSCINRAAKPDATIAIDENFRRICKIYLGHSLNYRNAHAIRLLNVALTHRQQLHLDPDEIEFVLSSYWRQLNDDIQMNKQMDIRCLEPAIKLIIGYKTNEDFLLLLRRLSAQVDEMKRPETAEQHASLLNVLILLGLFAKCSLSIIKGAMLNEYFEMISVKVGLRLPEPSDSFYAQHVQRLLEAQHALASNRTVPLTGETLDCLLGSMLDVDIKRYLKAGGTWLQFAQLYAKLTDNFIILLRQHGNLMSDRAPQLAALCQDLIQAIVCYRSERKAHDLSETELDGLGELGLKLTTVMASIAGTQALAVKRVAPFLLIFTIRQMVTTERPTTLFEKVKVHLVRVCHDLISMCDHRAGHFILRSSSEAGARMYESLVKEHQKYHRFRGKV